MKSVVVIDTPETCKECLFNGFNWNVCILVDEDIDEYVNPDETKPEWCPLRPLPRYREMFVGDRDKREVMLGKAYLKGWNDCLEEIMGETE